jgi:hypothetical protein
VLRWLLVSEQLDMLVLVLANRFGSKFLPLSFPALPVVVAHSLVFLPAVGCDLGVRDFLGPDLWQNAEMTRLPGPSLVSEREAWKNVGVE